MQQPPTMMSPYHNLSDFHQGATEQSFVDNILEHDVYNF